MTSNGRNIKPSKPPKHTLNSPQPDTNKSKPKQPNKPIPKIIDTSNQNNILQSII